MSPLRLRGSAGSVPLFLPLAAALQLACGAGEATLTVTPPIVWSAPDASGELPEAAVAHRLVVPAGVEPWRIGGAEGRAVTLPGGELGLLLQSDEPRRHVWIDGPFEPGTFDTLIVGVHCNVPVLTLVEADLFRGGRAVVEAHTTAQPSGQLIETVSIDLQDALLQTAPFEALRLRVTSPAASIGLTPISLLSIPPLQRVPLPEDGSVLAGIEGDWRLAVGVGVGRPARAELVLPAGARSLELSSGGSTALASSGAAALHLRLEPSQGDPVEARYPLPAAPGWTEVSLPLEGVGEGAATLSVSLEGAQGAVRLVEEPRVVAAHGPTPTVILVTSDTHRADHVSAQEGGVEVDTPSLDALSERGVLFTDAWSATNVTVPSHASILTAVSPRDTGVIDNMVRLADGAPTLAAAFRSRGFRTVAVASANLLSPHRSGLGTGFQRFSVAGRDIRSAEDSVAAAVREVERSAGQPLFLWLHLFDAHTPYKPPQDLRDHYWSGRANPYDESLPALGIDPARLPQPMRDLRDIEYPRAMYRAEVTNLDRELLRLLEHPRVREGVVAFTADHGESLGGHGVWFAHNGLYPSSLHVPLLLAWPGCPAGTRTTHPVSTIDLGRTLLDLAGLTDTPFGGRNLAADLAQPPPVEPRFAFGSGAASAAVTLDGWHLILHLESSRNTFDIPHARHSVELYELGPDPACEHDLATERPQMAGRLRGLLVDWLLSADPQRMVTVGTQDLADLEQLADLGYTTEHSDSGDGPWFDAACDCGACAQFD